MVCTALADKAPCSHSTPVEVLRRAGGCPDLEDTAESPNAVLGPRPGLSPCLRYAEE